MAQKDLDHFIKKLKDTVRKYKQNIEVYKKIKEDPKKDFERNDVSEGFEDEAAVLPLWSTSVPSSSDDCSLVAIVCSTTASPCIRQPQDDL